MIDVSLYSAYDIGLYLYNVTQATAGSSLTVPVTLTWFDDLSGIPVFAEEWDIWVANNSV